MSSVSAALDAVRRPEYTGENRCIPCTAVNSVIAVALAAVAWVYVAPALGIAVLAVSASAIALRGYLVPGTPTLTKRYLPDRILALFDKAPDSATSGATGVGERDADGPPEVDVEGVLVTTGILQPCADRDDLCLEDGFHETWREQMEAIGAGSGGGSEEGSGGGGSDGGAQGGTGTGDATAAAVADLLDVDVDALDLRDRGQRAFIATYDGVQVGQWESRAALVADAAAAPLVSARDPKWTDRPVAARGELLGGLRLFLESCPECGGPVTFGRETVESCCRSREVVAVSCDSCGARLFEADYDG